ncbi:MAG: glycosyl hydrolase family 5 [Acetobacteraceae bacterium]|nr:glycosyl hydrolase family 5 [Acetobacteraceae bacterium]
MSRFASRRQLLGVGGAGLAAAAAPWLAPSPVAAQALSGAAMDGLRLEWTAFRQRFLAPEGRVVDTGNRNISHSEGQGWAMLAAVRSDDRASFELMLGWTRRTLKRPRDHLHAWRFRPRASNPVDDLNNATDGDLFIAWALLEAGARWGVADHTALGQAIARDVLRLLIAPAGPYLVMLPGARGFDRRETVVVNPSYYAFPAIRALATAVPDPLWVRAASDGVALLRGARFGRWGLPPDWLMVSRADGRLSLPDAWPPRFSYDAVRVPLFAAWVGLGREPAVTGPADFWNDPGHAHLPAWADLTSNTISPYAASPGIAGVARLATAHRVGMPLSSAQPRGPSPMPDYYSAGLTLLAALATRETGMASM